MKRIVFFSTPAFGHIISSYPIIQALVKKGHQVIWYGSKKYQEYAQKSGAHFIEYEKDFESEYKLSEVTSNFYQLLETLVHLNQCCFETYVESVDWSKVDLIVYDSMCSFGKSLGHYFQKKHLCICTTLAYNWWVLFFSNMGLSSLKLSLKHFREGIEIWKQERAFRKRWVLPRFKLVDYFVNEGQETIVLSPRKFQPFAFSFPSSFHFVGTTIKERVVEARTQYEPFEIYISLGSIYTETDDVLERILAQIKDEKTIVTVGNKKLKESRKNVVWTPFSDQLSLLPKVKLFINHGGLNSVYESLYFGIDQVCIPMQEEMKMTAMRLQRLGLGSCVMKEKKLSLKDIEQRKHSSKKRLEEFSQYIRGLDGTYQSVTIIEQLLER